MTFYSDVRSALVGILSSSTIRILFRRGTAAEWTAANPILAAGEPGYEIDTKFEKRGDGLTAWSDLAYSPSAAQFSTKAPLESPAFTGTPTVNGSPLGSNVTFGTDSNGYDTITAGSGQFGTDSSGFDTITI